MRCPFLRAVKPHAIDTHTLSNTERETATVSGTLLEAKLKDVNFARLLVGSQVYHVDIATV